MTRAYPRDRQTTTAGSMLAAALTYARRGVPVFPLQPGRKEPATQRGFYDATTDPETIRRWWARVPTANIGIPTGEASGWLVLDVDPDRGGRESLERLEATHGPIGATLRVRTGGAGEHIILRYPAGEKVANSAGKLGPGLDVRGEGGYIVAAPSRTTGPYEVQERTAPANMPAWLPQALRAAGERERRAGKRSGRAHTSGALELSEELDGPPIPDGGRNTEITRIAGRLRARGAGDAELLEALESINAARCAPPLEAAEVQAIAKSASRWPAGTARREPDAQTLAELEDIAAGIEAGDWRGMGERSARDVAVALVKAAREYGERIPAGVRVSISVRALALASGLSKRSTGKAIQRLKEAGYVRRDDRNRSGTIAGGLVLVRRAKVAHSTTHGEAKEPRASLVGYPCAHPYSAPRLRWSAPEYERGERAGTIYRLGKTAGAVVDALEAAGGTLTLAELSHAVGISRPRDLRRQDGPLSRLESAAVVECSGDTVSLAADWSGALDNERERAGEIAAHRRDMARFDRERGSHRQSLEGARRGGVEPGENPASEPPAPPPVVDPSPTAAEMAERRESAPQRRREAVERAIVALFQARPEYRVRRVGQIACALGPYLAADFPVGVAPRGAPKDSEVAEILTDNALEVA